MRQRATELKRETGKSTNYNRGDFNPSLSGTDRKVYRKLVRKQVI